MLHQAFNEVYTKFKLHFYQEIFRRFQDREASLTTVETFCMESIMALGRPTVNEFATFMCISPPNAAYKVNSLVKKGYIRKIQSPSDRREFHLEVTQKYIDYYNISSNYMSEVMDRIMARFSPEDCGKLEEILTVVSRELMPEVPLPERTEEGPPRLRPYPAPLRRRWFFLNSTSFSDKPGGLSIVFSAGTQYNGEKQRKADGT